jgi:hypothetical protein
VARAGADRLEAPLLAAAGREVRFGAGRTDPPLRGAGLDRVDRDEPLLLTVDLLVADPPPTPRTVDREGLLPPLRTVDLVAALAVPTPLPLTLAVGRVVRLPDAGWVVRGVALDPTAGLRSNTGRPAPDEGGVTLVRAGGWVRGTNVPPEGLLVAVLPFVPGPLYPDDPLTDRGPTLFPEPAGGVVFRGCTRRFAVPLTPGWEAGGGFLTTT